MGNPFLDQARVHGDLYADPDRLRQRTSALNDAKIVGTNVADTIVDLLTGYITDRSTVADLGCGRGSTTLAIAHAFGCQLTALDASASLLDAAAARFSDAGAHIDMQVADFHRLPFGTASLDAAVAAFCLYHSPAPSDVIAEIGRTLRPEGVAVLVTKSADSYHELDRLLVETALDTGAADRPSLYTSFHSGNAAAIAAQHLTLGAVLHHPHVFRFTDAEALAQYIRSTPRYRPDGPPWDADLMTETLRRWTAEQPVTLTSTVTYVLAARP